MSGNSLYIVCIPCQQHDAQNPQDKAEFGFKLADRGVIGPYQTFGPKKSAEMLTNWLRKHARCGAKNDPDHFGLAQLKPRNHDQPDRVRDLSETRILNS